MLLEMAPYPPALDWTTQVLKIDTKIESEKMKMIKSLLSMHDIKTAV